MKRDTAIKILLTLLLVGVLFLKVDILDVIRIIISMNAIFLLMALCLVPVLMLLRTLRWSRILGALGIRIPFTESLKVFLIGNFYGLITPGRIGEIGRAYHLGESKTITIPTVILEKMIDILSLILLSLVTIVLFFEYDSIMLLLTGMCIIVVLLGTFFLTSERCLPAASRIFGVDSNECETFSSTLRKLLRDYPLIAYSLVLAFVYYGIAYLFGYLVARSAGFDTGVIIAMPLIVLIGNIPLTIAGIGIRESVGSLAFVYLGSSPADGVVFAFLFFLFITVIPGIFGYLLTMKRPDPDPEPGQITGFLSPFLESLRLKKISGKVTGGDVLDYGCGGGAFLSHLKFTTYTGTDKNDNTLILPRQKYLQNESVSFITLKEFESSEKKYDFIILSAVLEHLPDPFATLENLSARLKMGGKIVVTTPTTKGNALLGIGAKLGIFSRTAFEEHHQILSRHDFASLAGKLDLNLATYETFELGMNQFVVLSREP